jgi:hypothetical protein
VYKQAPDYTREGGSIPVTLTFAEALGVNVLLLPMGRGDDGAQYVFTSSLSPMFYQLALIDTARRTRSWIYRTLFRGCVMVSLPLFQNRGIDESVGLQTKLLGSYLHEVGAGANA